MAIFKLELVQLDLSGEQTNGRVGEKETLRPKIQPHFVRHPSDVRAQPGVMWWQSQTCGGNPRQNANRPNELNYGTELLFKPILESNRRCQSM